ncbi:g1883 [Coccomyxa elongata]
MTCTQLLLASVPLRAPRYTRPQVICSSHYVNRYANPCLAHRAATGFIGAAALAAALCIPHRAHASSKVGEFTGNGFIFKDTVEVVAVEDPDVEGVTVYISDFKRSLVDKLSKDFFSEPSQASVTCAATGPVRIKDMNKVKGSGGGEVFSESKGLNFFQNKTLRVRRLYDEARNTLTYIAYSTRLSNSGDRPSPSQYRTSICALPISPEVSSAAAAGQS